VVAGKIGSLSFHPKSHFQPFFFYLKHLKNTLETLLNQSMATQKPTNRLKTRNPPKIKILLKLKYVVLGVFKVKKTLKRNPPHHMEPSNIKINCLIWWIESSLTTTFSL
jgi:hypothetical protein